MWNNKYIFFWLSYKNKENILSQIWLCRITFCKSFNQYLEYYTRVFLTYLLREDEIIQIWLFLLQINWCNNTPSHRSLSTLDFSTGSTTRLVLPSSPTVRYVEYDNLWVFYSPRTQSQLATFQTLSWHTVSIAVLQSPNIAHTHMINATVEYFIFC